jgi:hypothetical protein
VTTTPESDVREQARQQVADELEGIAAEPELEPQRAQLTGLADALRQGSDLDGWAEIDLLDTFTRPESLRPSVPGTQQSRARTVLDMAPSVLLFLPILITWLGLAMATRAYGDLMAHPPAGFSLAGKTFLQLWQEGFGGKLAGAFGFSSVAVYTLVAVLLLVIVTVTGGIVRRREETAATAGRAELMHRMIPILTRAQLALGRYRLDASARHAAELYRATGQLAALVERTERTHAAVLDVAVCNRAAAEQLGTSTAALNGVIANLQVTAQQAYLTTDALTDAGVALKRVVTDHVSSASALLDETMARAGRQLAESGTAGKGLLEQTGRQVNAVLEGTAERIGEATRALTSAGERFAEAVAEAGTQVAEDVVQTYQHAVAAATVSLSQEMRRTGSELTAAVEAMRGISERNVSGVAEMQTVADRFVAVAQVLQRMQETPESRTEGQDKPRAAAVELARTGRAPRSAAGNGTS